MPINTQVGEDVKKTAELVKLAKELNTAGIPVNAIAAIVVCVVVLLIWFGGVDDHVAIHTKRVQQDYDMIEQHKDKAQLIIKIPLSDG